MSQLRSHEGGHDDQIASASRECCRSDCRDCAVDASATADESHATFECKFDKEPDKACSSPRKVKHLDEGKHKFKVVATDAAGNTDPTAAKDKFKVLD